MNAHQDRSASDGASSYPKMLNEAEYAALRDEILKRIELQYQLLNLALIITATLLTISLGGGVLTDPAGNSGRKLLLLLCPPLEMFLALGWADHNVQIAKAGVFIKNHYHEAWETTWPQNEGLRGWRELAVKHLFIGGVPAMGVFVCTQILTLILAHITFIETNAATLWHEWYIIDVVAILLTGGCIYASNIRTQLLKPPKVR